MTRVIYTPAHGAHTTPNHPEYAGRLEAVSGALHSELAGWDEARPASTEQLLRVHTPGLISAVEQLASRNTWFSLDTYTTPATYDVARACAGAAVQAVDAVLGEGERNSFAIVRPPGHHATPDQAMGFCFFNNIAVAARHATAVYGLRRVAIVDYDVHHGNGTQDIFYNAGDVLFCSTHAYGRLFFPGTGAAEETGAGAGAGLTLNVPLPAGAGDESLALAFDTLILPALERFRPELILVSAGYDAHWADPLGPLLLSVDGYSALTRKLIDAADRLCGGRIVCVLEGGYDLEALAACTTSTLRLLGGQQPPLDPLGPARERERDASSTIMRLHATHPLLRK